MGIVLIRALILYILVVFAVRLMGKRQLGELQPSELVITILVSNIATLPLEDTNIPVLLGITPILALVCFEVVVSWLSLKLPRLRRVISGSPKIIISGGKIDPSVLRELRFSVDDLMTSLRGQGIFDLAEIQFAVVETTGSISVMKKPADDTPTRADLGISAKNADPPQTVIADGAVMERVLKNVGITERDVENALKKADLRAEEVFIMTADGSGKIFISKKEEHK